MSANKTQWKAAKQHQVTLPSGTEVAISIPHLPSLIKANQIPNELVDIAIKQAGQGVDAEQIDADLIGKLADFQRYLVSITVVEPKISEEDVDDLPYPDIEMIVQFATRERNIDAVGHQLGGLETLDSYKKFRDQQLSTASALGLSGIG